MNVYVKPPTKFIGSDGVEFEIAYCSAHNPFNPDNVFLYVNDAGEEISEEEYFTLYPNPRHEWEKKKKLEEKQNGKN